MPASIDCAKAGVTTGEWTDALRSVFGEYRAPTGVARTVFEATAVHDGRDGDLVEVVPYLVRAVFQDFPGANAQVRRISFELKKP